jgi:hypothetical protein
MIGSQIDLEIQTVMFQTATTAGRWKQGHNQVLSISDEGAEDMFKRSQDVVENKK